jgi:hypothetical protein
MDALLDYVDEVGTCSWVTMFWQLSIFIHTWRKKNFSFRSPNFCLNACIICHENMQVKFEFDHGFLSFDSYP